MTKLVICRGVPGSGKTTLAKRWVAQDPSLFARVNKDDLRAMLHESAYLGKQTESQVNAVRDNAIRSLLKKGINVVSDDTNLPDAVAQHLAQVAADESCWVEVWDLTGLAVDICVERDAARRHPVGEKVIRKMHRKHVEGRGFPLPPVQHGGPTIQEERYHPKAGTPKAIMVDIDGTVALHTGVRSPYDETLVHLDQPNVPVIAAIRDLVRSANYQVVYCSGRTDACRDATERWITDNVQHYGPLFMRKDGDKRKDWVVKRELFDAHIRDSYDVFAVFDDRNRVVDMWRRLGLTVFQVADGDF